MFSMLFATLLAIFLGFFIFLIAWIICKQSIADREKSSPFECGFDPLGSARVPFSLRFFLLAVIFLIFDVEIVLLIPAVKFLSFSSHFISIYMIVLFLIILIWGLFHEWKEGSLDWMI
uniref:NADH dehydrogenase subunit 3 n=1 Tax=Melanodrymia galeronae TaxID=3096626 RepID=UPI002E77B3EB|nr:NADH dehydrogenase subunit 3 [Melanodrymia galeronae]WQA11502.1 NADH dehydrogenase subunit 3 [Melanodrymia galeronae]